MGGPVYVGRPLEMVSEGVRVGPAGLNVRIKTQSYRNCNGNRTGPNRVVQRTRP